MSDYNLFSQHMSNFCRSSTCSIIFIPRLVTTSFLQFFAVLVRGSCILKPFETGPVCGPSEKGNKTETGPDFKALLMYNSLPWAMQHSSSGQCQNPSLRRGHSPGSQLWLYHRVPPSLFTRLPTNWNCLFNHQVTSRMQWAFILHVQFSLLWVMQSLCRDDTRDDMGFLLTQRLHLNDLIT